MKKLTILFILLGVVGVISAQAQKQAETEPKPRSGFGIYSAGVGFGYYKPSFKYWNDRTGFHFNGGVMPSAQADFDLVPNIRGRVSAAYFNNQASFNSQTSFLPRGESWEQTISTSLTPISLSSYVYLPGSILTLYSGLGVDLVSVKSVYTSPAKKQTNRGTTTTGHFLLGMETSADHFLIGLEGRYYLGSFNQRLQVTPDSDPFTEKVRINGPYVGLNLKYLFSVPDKDVIK